MPDLRHSPSSFHSASLGLDRGAVQELKIYAGFTFRGWTAPHDDRRCETRSPNRPRQAAGDTGGRNRASLTQVTTL